MLYSKSLGARPAIPTTTPSLARMGYTLEVTSSIWELGDRSGARVIRIKHHLKSKTIEHVYYSWRGVERHGRTANR